MFAATFTCPRRDGTCQMGSKKEGAIAVPAVQQTSYEPACVMTWDEMCAGADDMAECARDVAEAVGA